MRRQEHYYIPEFYACSGIEPFTAHVRKYFAGQRSVPISRTKDIHSRHLFFTFADNLLQRFVTDPDSIKKPYEVALKYGFRGYSIGGKNGIFFLRKEDDGLQRAVDRLIPVHEELLREDLELPGENVDDICKVKIVWHSQSGERIVGIYNTKNNKILFLDFARY